MKLTIGVVAISMMVGGAAAQKPDAIDNARNTVKSLQQQQAAKPSPVAPAPVIKPATVPTAKTPAPAAKPAASTSSQTVKLQKVNVVPGGNDIQIEISSSQAVTPRVSKLSSPARLLVELPETVMANSQSKIPVGTGGVKGVRIGMDGKTPPTTSVVVDLDQPVPYEIAPGPAGKTILILHAQGSGPAVAKNTPAPTPTKTAAPIANTQPGAKAAAAPSAAPTKVPVTAKATDTKAPAAKPAAAAKVADTKAPAAKPVPVPVKVDSKQQPAKTVVAAKPAPATPVKVAEAPKQPKPEEKKWSMSGKRDPFFSPVVQQHGSGCATGKKCLEIGAINVRGVVKSDTGFIAVVTNNLNKAYFLRENDPVFNGYVVKITGDSIVFKQNFQDRLGKPFTKDVVKRITTPAV
jgi:hypothetical protein